MSTSVKLTLLGRRPHGQRSTSDWSPWIGYCFGDRNFSPWLSCFCTTQPSAVGKEIGESAFALRHRIHHGSVVAFRLSWPPLKKWWRTMLLASSKTVTAKTTMNNNFTNPSPRGFCSSESTLFRFVVMSCSPADQSASLGLLGRAPSSYKFGRV
jgi:hypothetical protein